MKYDLPLYRALNKYGIHNFDIDILYSFVPTTSNEDTIKLLDEIEVKFIEEYNAYTDGYNCTVGGDYGVLGLKMTDQQKKKISASSRKAVAEGKSGKRVYMYNFIEKYYIYAWTINDAENITKVSRNNISKLCNNRYRTIYCSNFIAAFSKEELEERKKDLLCILPKISIRKGNSSWKKGMTSLNKGKIISEDQKKKISNSLTRYSVLQYDTDMNFVMEYSSINEACSTFNADPSQMRAVCRQDGKHKTCKGFIWRYKNIEAFEKQRKYPSHLLSDQQ